MGLSVSRSALNLEIQALIRGCAALGVFVDDYRALLTPTCVTIFFSSSAAKTCPSWLTLSAATLQPARTPSVTVTGDLHSRV